MAIKKLKQFYNKENNVIDIKDTGDAIYDGFSFKIKKNHIIMLHNDKEIGKAKRSKLTNGLKNSKEFDKLIEAGLGVFKGGECSEFTMMELINDVVALIVDDTVDYDEDEITGDYHRFQKLLERYDNNLPKIIKDYVLDYINNERVLSVQILLSLMTGLGLDGTIMDINAPAGSGKTENQKCLFKLIPNGKELGKVTPAAVYRLNSNDYNCFVLFTNDKGLERGEQKAASEEVQAILRELATDKQLKKIISKQGSSGTQTYIVNVEALSVIITELHTSDAFQMGRQMERVTVRLDINPITVAEYREIVKKMQKPENQQKVEDFYRMHRNYMTYLIENSNINEIIPDEVLEAIENLKPVDVTEYKRLISLYRTYCIYFGLDLSKTSNVNDFGEFLNILNKVSQYEQMLFDHLKKYVSPLDDEKLPDKSSELIKVNYTDDEISDYQKFRLTRKRKEQSNGTYHNNYDEPIYFFTVQDVKNCHIYNKGRPLHEYKDMAGNFLQRLRNAGLIEYVNTKGDERLYYIPKEQ